jgi:hypothetical protein
MCIPFNQFDALLFPFPLESRLILIPPDSFSPSVIQSLSHSVFKSLSRPTLRKCTLN